MDGSADPWRKNASNPLRFSHSPWALGPARVTTEGGDMGSTSSRDLRTVIRCPVLPRQAQTIVRNWHLGGEEDLEIGFENQAGPYSLAV